MVVIFVSIALLTILFYGKIFFIKQTRKANKENKRKMEYYNRINTKRTIHLEDY